MEQFIGPVKIKDALFMGDQIAAQDLEFLITNKISFIINCAGNQIPNLWESIGIRYLTFNWMETDKEILFDKSGIVLQKIFQFIEESQKTGESCLVHSEKGQSRSSCVIVAYLIKKYNWCLYKALEYLNSRRPDLEIRASFFQQLNYLESRLSEKITTKFSQGWNTPTFISLEEKVIRNTYLNGQNGKVEDINKSMYKISNITKQTNEKSKNKLKWRDEVINDKNQLISLTIPNRFTKQLKNYNQIQNQAKNILKNTKKAAKSSQNQNNEKELNSSEINNGNNNEAVNIDQKINNITGNIIHVTVNNFINQNSIDDGQPNSVKSNMKNNNEDDIYNSILQKYSGIKKPKEPKIVSQYQPQKNRSTFQMNYKKTMTQKQPTPPKYFDRQNVSKKSNKIQTQDRSQNGTQIINNVLNYPQTTKKSKSYDFIRNKTTMPVNFNGLTQKNNPIKSSYQDFKLQSISQDNNGIIQMNKSVNQEQKKKNQGQIRSSLVFQNNRLISSANRKNQNQFNLTARPNSCQQNVKQSQSLDRNVQNNYRKNSNQPGVIQMFKNARQSSLNLKK